MVFVVDKPRDPVGLTLEAWAEGFLVGSLVIMFGVALAKALAKPPVAAELSLPLVAPGGAAILWLADSADRAAVAAVADRLGGLLEADADGLVVLRKVRATPPGFPRRPGIAKKRPLA